MDRGVSEVVLNTWFPSSQYFKITQLAALGSAFLLEQEKAELFCPRPSLLQNSREVIPVQLTKCLEYLSWVQQ